MTNYEANAEILIEIMSEGDSSFGVNDTTGQIAPCNNMACVNCKFRTMKRSCRDQRTEWLKEEVKPTITEEVLETVREVCIECADISCEDCVYHTLNDVSRKRETCIAARITDALKSRFNVTKKED